MKRSRGGKEGVERRCERDPERGGADARQRFQGSVLCLKEETKSLRTAGVAGKRRGPPDREKPL